MLPNWTVDESCCLLEEEDVANYCYDYCCYSNIVAVLLVAVAFVNSVEKAAAAADVEL